MTKDLAGSGETTIIAIGWWCNEATEEANYSVGIYDDDNNSPDVLLYSDTTNAKGTTSGWKEASVSSWSITENNKYWIAIALADTSSTTSTDYGSGPDGTANAGRQTGTGDTLPEPFTGSLYTAIYAIYAKVAGGGAPSSQVIIIAEYNPAFGVNIIGRK